jgi:putative endonuclease
MAAHNDFGRAAEVEAAALLQRNGWTILGRNWRSGRQEIDLIARKGAVVAFVEVKARASDRYGHPLQAIDWRKRRSLARAARAWIRSHAGQELDYRFDAVHVIGDHKGVYTIRHIEDAWWAGGE